MRLSFIVIAAGIYLISCTGEKFDPIISGQCHDSPLTDSLAIHAKLIGTWTWTEQYCPCCPGVKPTRADKEVIATFNTDATFSVIEESTVVSSGTWEVQENSDRFSVVLEGETSYLDGYITVCNKELMADMTPLDGCRNLFVKSD